MTVPAGPGVGQVDPEYSGIVTLTELLEHMSGLDLPADHQKRAARRTLLGVQRSLERRLNRPVELTQVREAVTADTMGYLNLTVTPVLKIISRTPVGDVNYDTNYGWMVPYVPVDMVRDDLVSEDVPMIDKITVPNLGAPLMRDGGLFSGAPGQTYVVEYIGGYNGAADFDLKQKIMDVAARTVERNHDDTLSLREGEAEQAAPSDSRDLGWTDAEIKSVMRLKRRVIATSGPLGGWWNLGVTDDAFGYYW